MRRARTPSASHCGEQLVQRLRLAGDDDGARAVDRRDGDPRRPSGRAARPCLGGRQGHGHHAAVPGQFPAISLLRSGDDARRRPRGTDHPRRTRRRSRPGSGRPPRPARRRRNATAPASDTITRPGRRLDHVDPVQDGRVLRASTTSAATSRRSGASASAHALHPLRRTPATDVQQLAPHAGPLRRPGRGTRTRRRPAVSAAPPRPPAAAARRRRPARRARPAQSVAVGADDHGPVLEGRAGRRQGAADVGGRRLGVPARCVSSRPAWARSASVGPAGQHPGQLDGGRGAAALRRARRRPSGRRAPARG